MNLSTPLQCQGDLHVWDFAADTCRCGSRASEPHTWNEPSLRDVLARLDRIEHKLDIIFPEQTP